MPPIDDDEFRAAYRRMIAADNAALLRAETALCDTCDHLQSAHIYYEGACRPGFVCPDACTQFVAPMTMADTLADTGPPVE